MRASFPPYRPSTRASIAPGWYADPEARVFEGRDWLFPTFSAPYNSQVFLDTFSSNDLVT